MQIVILFISVTLLCLSCQSTKKSGSMDYIMNDCEFDVHLGDQVCFPKSKKRAKR
jgi:hypothetical protein